MAELPHLSPVHILQQFPCCLTFHRRQLLAQQLDIVQGRLYIGQQKIHLSSQDLLLSFWQSIAQHHFPSLQIANFPADQGKVL